MVNHDNLSESACSGVTAVILIFSTLLSLSHLYKLLHPALYMEAQKYLICIFLMPILIGWTSWVELLELHETRVVVFLVNLFKAVCLASFMMYIDRMLGWKCINGENFYSEEKKIQVLVTGRPPVCVLRCFKFLPIKEEADAVKYLKNVKIYVFQFCFVLATLGIIAGIILLSLHDVKQGEVRDNSQWVWFTVVQMISSIFALCFLLNFGMYVNKIPEMATLQILHKFIIIKLGLFFTEFQPIVVGIFAEWDLIASTSKYSKSEITVYTNSLLLCSEMIIMSFLLILIYPIDDYKKTPDHRKSLALEEEGYSKL